MKVASSSLVDLKNCLNAYADFAGKIYFGVSVVNLWGNLRCFVFGHNIYEKSVTPYIGLTAKAIIIDVSDEFFDAPVQNQIGYLDITLGKNLNESGRLSNTHNLHPFPLLGMPGWYADTDDSCFYDNTDYFRPGRWRDFVNI